MTLHRAQLKNLSVPAEEGALVLQTYTVPLEEVGANLSEWRSALLSEYESLTVLTKAIEPIDAQELQGDTSVEYAPGKLVATVKALDGKKRPGLSAAETELSLLWTSRMSSSSTTTPTSSTREKNG